jgi:protein arginine N-methyltransferase 7
MTKTGRNDPCPCGSGKKYKNCCQPRDEAQATARSPRPSIPDGIRTAMEHHQAGRLSQAELVYRQMLQAAPNVAELHSNLGNVLEEQGKLDEAVKCYRKALSIKPDIAELHSNLGLTLKAQGKLDAAVECQRKAIALKPDYAAAHYNLGLTLEVQGKLEEAIASYRKTIELNPSLLDAHNGMTSALSRLVPLWHVPMMNDTARNEAYYSALKAAITSESRVFEIGTGSGLLSMMAAKLGARTVTTCEAEPLIAATAKRIISDNKLDKRINLIARKSTDLTVGADMADQADILVSEIFSSELLGERVLPSIEDAKRRLLKPGCRIIPAVGSIMIALFGGEDIASNLVVEDSCGFDLRQFNSIVPRRQTIARNDLNIEMLSDDIEAFRFDFENGAFFPAEEKTLRIPARSAGRCCGIIQWIRLEMDKDFVFENHPSSKTAASGWMRCAYVFSSPVELRPNQVARVFAAHNRIFPWFSLEGIE